MVYTLTHIARILGINTVQEDYVVTQLLIDSRKLVIPSGTIFFALRTSRRSGLQFVDELYKKGVRAFVIDQEIDALAYPQATFIKVPNTLFALQKLAAYHRKQFSLPVIGITGSNGKTIVKEWLFQLLHEQENIVRSPKSYNSQIGVALSVWGLHEQATLAIFEAGISQPGEMYALRQMIDPTIGVLTTLGDAHSEGFLSTEEKLLEKCKLFAQAKLIVTKNDIVDRYKNLVEQELPNACFFTWGNTPDCDLIITAKDLHTQAAVISYSYKEHSGQFSIPFTDKASVENAITCFTTVLAMGYSIQVMTHRLQQLQPVNMRLEVKKGLNNCIVINDSYSTDISSLEIALNFLLRQGKKKITVILSDFLQSGMDNTSLYQKIITTLIQHGVTRAVLIGPHVGEYLQQHNVEINVQHFFSTQDFLNHATTSSFKDEAILVKGARTFAFEQIVSFLEEKAHQTVLEINLTALIHNLKEFQKHIHPSTKVMAMVKAFAYGSGAIDVASILQFHKVDYLGVAYVDEGVELRKAGITVPIMVMNPEASAFDALVTHNLQPDIFSLEIAQQFDSFLKQENISQYPIHLEIETGMNRLGFTLNEIEGLCHYLQGTQSFYVVSVFTHLVASEDPALDSFSHQQYQLFTQAVTQVQSALPYPFLRHMANSSAAIRHPLYQMDMVRLGIGLYGINNSKQADMDLLPVVTFKSTIAQVKNVKKGESVSYNRKGIVMQDSVIATIRLGYADGYPRRLGNGVAHVLVKGLQAQVIGTICMDMLMIDVTHIPQVEAGSEVIIFGVNPTVEQVATWGNTIPYEILTGISQRVKRVYYEE